MNKKLYKMKTDDIFRWIVSPIDNTKFKVLLYLKTNGEWCDDFPSSISRIFDLGVVGEHCLEELAEEVSDLWVEFL